VNRDIWFTRLVLKRSAANVAPLVNILAPSDGGAAMTTTHRLMWSAMPPEIQARWDRANPSPETRAAFLWREADRGGKYYLLGPRPVHESPWFEIATKPFDPMFVAGDRLSFDLRVNATVERKIAAGESGRSNRMRIDVAMDFMLREEHNLALDRGTRADRRLPSAEAAVRTWLENIGERDGFRIVSTRLAAYRVEVLPRKPQPARFGISDLSGLIEVIDPVSFLDRVVAGFGRAKAFGCGLMLLRRAPLS
jgi:CRISPR system Cascade subunit CasE